MYELKKNGKVFTSKFVGTRRASYEKRIYRAAVSQRLRFSDIKHSAVLSPVICEGVTRHLSETFSPECVCTPPGPVAKS